ncbi:glutathione S-transferase family protein [Humitalea sp. 24SJ18S-53]|uniref:glutathione S-transferase family protein n=1 Tax=Humitalea sp. 24SJ18S-53 TaxID=3422307 RepID=UPI003D678C39
MITIYGVLRSRASRNVWLLHEMGREFRHVPVIQVGRLADPASAINTRSADFLAINPNGLIPSMDDDGLVLHESLAINLHLARKYGGALGPADAVEDSQMGMWTLWAATNVEPHSIQVLYNRAAKPVAERDAALADASVAALRGPVAVLELHLAQSGFLVGGRFTVADVNVAEVMRYALPAPELFTEAPAVRAWIAACHARPAFKRMMAERDAEA